jgi:hypothetical protein
MPDVTDAIDQNTAAEIAGDTFIDHFAAEIADLALLYAGEPYEKVGSGLAALRRALESELSEEVLDALVVAGPGAQGRDRGECNFVGDTFVSQLRRVSLDRMRVLQGHGVRSLGRYCLDRLGDAGTKKPRTMPGLLS